MSIHSGPADWWTEGTNSGRKHIATKGIVQNGLVLNLDAGISDSYPGTGTTWTDLSSNGNNGTLVNGVGYSNTEFNFLSFDGSNDYINISNSSSLNITTNNITIEIAFKSNNLADASHGDGLISKGYSSNNDGVYELLTVQQNSKNYLYFRCATLGNHTPKIIPIDVGNIYIVSAVLQNGLMITYVNGIAEDTGSQKTGNIISSTSDVTIGTRFLQRGTSNSALNGNVYLARIYNRALSSQEIQQNFNVLRNRFGL